MHINDGSTVQPKLAGPQPHGFDDGFNLGAPLERKRVEELRTCLAHRVGQARWKLLPKPTAGELSCNVRVSRDKTFTELAIEDRRGSIWRRGASIRRWPRRRTATSGCRRHGPAGAGGRVPVASPSAGALAQGETGVLARHQGKEGPARPARSQGAWQRIAWGCFGVRWWSCLNVH